MKTKLIFYVLLFMGIKLFSQNIYFSDSQFKQGLLAHGVTITGTGISVIDLNGDAEISYSEALAYHGTIRLNYYLISDLTGIQSFTNITVLECAYNSLTHLNISQNFALETLVCMGNNLSNLQVSNLTSLRKINCSVNSLTSFTAPVSLEELSCASNFLSSLNVSNAYSLKRLYCNDNNLTAIDLSSNGLLESLIASDNQLSNIRFISNAELRYLNIGNNQLSNMSVASNPKLEHLNFSYNQLSTINTSSNPKLVYLYGSNNQLTQLNVTTNLDLYNLSIKNNEVEKLDLSKNYNLSEIDCSNNQLKRLNVANTNNQNSSYYRMYAHNNPSLKCIKIDPNFTPSTYSYWWNKDANARYSSFECPLESEPGDLGFPSRDLSVSGGNRSSEENNVIDDIVVYPNPTKDIVTVKYKGKINKLSLYDVTGHLLLERKNTNQLIISDIKKGVYSLLIYVDGLVVSKKIIKD